MHPALISALTAAVVTLLIEYAAKPHLEARKDRVLEKVRGRRELRARMAVLQLDLWSLWRVRTATEVAKEELGKSCAEADSLYRKFALFAESFPGRQRSLINHHLGRVRSDLLSWSFYLENEKVSQKYLEERQRMAQGRHFNDPLDILAYTSIMGADVVHAALTLSPKRPWRYYWGLKDLSRI